MVNEASSVVLPRIIKRIARRILIQMHQNRATSEAQAKRESGALTPAVPDLSYCQTAAQGETGASGRGGQR